MFIAFLYYATNVVYSKMYIRHPAKQWKMVLDLADKLRKEYVPRIPTTDETRKKDLDFSTLRIMYFFPFEGEVGLPGVRALPLREYQPDLLIQGADIHNFELLKALSDAFWQKDKPPIFPVENPPEVLFPFPT